MDIKLINCTPNAKEMLILSKNTRHLSDPSRIESIFSASEEEKDKELDYVFSTISGPWEFVDYIFLIRNVTRAFTHQLVRHRVGTSFAQQSLRVTPMEDFEYLVPDGIEADRYQAAVYDATMMHIATGYQMLIHRGAETQDARGVLPTNIMTNILLKINLRALSLLMETRLCVRAQGEFQDAAFSMRSEVLNVHPWAERVLYPNCITKEKCLFPRFKSCPIKNKYPHLQPIPEELANSVKYDWGKIHEHKFSPQPEQDRGIDDEDEGIEG